MSDDQVPPLPCGDPPKPPSPPPSMQTSNQTLNRLDFDPGDGGNHSNIEHEMIALGNHDSEDAGPPSKRARMDVITALGVQHLEDGEIPDSDDVGSGSESVGTSHSEPVPGDQSSSASNSQNNLTPSDTDTPPSYYTTQAGGKAPPPPTGADTRGGEHAIEINGLPEAAVPEICIDAGASLESRSGSPGSEDLGLASGSASAEPNSSLDATLKVEYEILDDVESDVDDNEDDCDLLEGGDLDSDDVSYDEEEIEAMLDAGIRTYPRRRAARQGEAREGDDDEEDVAAPVEKEKIVLVERGHDPFDILPEGWVVVTHNSGMPIYLHKTTRVCTLSRPYFLGPGSARKHEVPASAIPCLLYRRALDKQAAEQAGTCPYAGTDDVSGDVDQSEATVTSDTADVNQTESVVKQEADADTNGVAMETDLAPSHGGDRGVQLGVKVESAADHKRLNSLDPVEVRNYCQKLFEFKTIAVKRFKTWKDRRKHNNMIKKASRPSLPSSTKLITCTIPSDKDNAKPNRRKEFVLNPAGKSDVCILHEYVQHAMRVQPRYEFEELENSQTPFSATVLINNIKYGTGYASSKRAAKLEAAKQTLSILIPEINKIKPEENDATTATTSSSVAPPADLSFFDQIKIEDPRVTELCHKAGQPGPYQVLCECLRRNYGVLADTQVQMEMKTLKHQKSEFIMTVGKHEAKVICKNKREGKQQAAQVILQKMHPHIHTWGSLLRLYDKSVIYKQSKETESVVDLQVQSKSLPNKAILAKLREEMLKLHAQQSEIKSKGKFQLPVGVDIPMTSNDLGAIDI